jgi:DNA-binding CsgD family transcriptional regulator
LEQVSTPIVQQLSALDRLETAVRADRSDLAAAWAGELHELADATGSPWAAAAAVDGPALLTGGGEAGELLRRALEQHERSRRRFDRARTQLAYGEFLRRSRRRVDTPTHLRAALETFDDLGASAWAERARNELRASGETARRRDASSAAELTPQELQVARVVRQGLSNRDAAAQLFVSPRTVDFHLRNVFAKLGVTSRAELATLTLE